MPYRALIIAIENYLQSKGDVAPKVDGAIKAGEDFAAWLIAKKNLSPANIFVCSDGGTYDQGVQRYGVQREQIIDAIVELIAVGQDQTEELYVLFSGHGFTFQDAPDKRAVAVMVAADFESAAKSGTKCIDLSEAQTKLWAFLGGLSHYYFLDACRNILNQGDVELVPFGRKLGRPSQRGRPTRYTLYSSQFGEPAAIDSPFAAALLDGLNGKGRAKGYTPERQLYVMFSLLKNYVANQMAGQKIDDTKEGSGDGYILQIQPIPTYTGKVAVEGAAPADQFQLKLAPAALPQFAQTYPFTGSEYQFTYQPGDLIIDVLENSQPLERIDPPTTVPLDLFDECFAKFRRPPQPVELRTGLVNLTAPRERLIRGINLNTGHKISLQPGASASVAAGVWEFSVLERGSAISKQVRDLRGLDSLNLDLTPSAADPVRGSIVSALRFNDATTPVVDFSESLEGATADRDLGLWLTVMAASHIIDPGAFDKLKDLPLLGFTQLLPNETATFVVSALEHYDRVRVAANGKWVTLEPVGSMFRVRQSAFPAKAGSNPLSVQLDKTPVRTLSSWNLPNRVTLVVLVEDERGRLVTAQFMIPAYHLLNQLPQAVSDYLQHQQPLQVVRTMYSLQRLFSQGRLLNPPSVEEKTRWDDLLYAKWIDPVTSLIVCYDIIRRGDEGLKHLLRDVVLTNLKNYFSGIPDIAAISEQLAPGTSEAPNEPPLFSEGLFAFPEWPDKLEYPARALDYGSLWTTWVAAVEAPPL
jgi:hypothetical protein